MLKLLQYCKYIIIVMQIKLMLLLLLLLATEVSLGRVTDPFASPTSTLLHVSSLYLG